MQISDGEGLAIISSKTRQFVALRMINAFHYRSSTTTRKEGDSGGKMIPYRDLQIMKSHRLNKAFFLTDRSHGNKLPAFFFFFCFRLVAYFPPFIFLLVAVISAHFCSALVSLHLLAFENN